MTERVDGYHAYAWGTNERGRTRMVGADGATPEAAERAAADAWRARYASEPDRVTRAFAWRRLCV